MEKIEANREEKHVTEKHVSKKPILTFSKVTNLIHVVIIVFTAFILYLSFSAKLDLFVWHPILFTIGWMLLMTEGIAALNKDNTILRGWLGQNRILIHWVLQTLALGLITGGFAIAFINKDKYNKSHFKSWHGIFGLLGVIFAVLSGLSGVLTLFNKELKSCYSPKLNKFIHVALGTLAYIFGGISAVLSVYTNWFKWKTSGEYSVFLIGLILCAIIIIWTSVKPIKSTSRRFLTLISM